MKDISLALQRCSSIVTTFSPALSPVCHRGLPAPHALSSSLFRPGVSRSYSHSPLSTRSTLIQLLHLIEDKREVQTYLARFRLRTSQRIAIIALAERSITSEGIAAFAHSLAFLKQVGLLPIVLHGALANSNPRPAQGQISRCDEAQNAGHRSRPSVLARILNANTQIAGKLEDLGIRARPITCGIFTIARDVRLEEKTYDQSSVATIDITRHPIEAALKAGCIPVLPCLGETLDGQVQKLDVHGTAAQLGVAMRPWRVVFLSDDMKRETGLDILKAIRNGPDIGQSIINLNDESQCTSILKLNKEHWMPRGWAVDRGEEKTLDTQGDGYLLRDLTCSSSVFLGHPSNLSASFLTNPGSGEDRGMLVRRGKKVHTARSLAQFPDITLIKTILMRQLGIDWRQARPIVEQYMHTLKTQPFVAYFDEGPTENLAIVHLEEGPFVEPRGPQLVAFAVSPHGWLDYIAEQIWSRIKADHESLVWTVRRDDEHLDWWFKRAQGSSKSGREVLFWYGNIGKVGEEISRMKRRDGNAEVMEVETVEEERLSAYG
jgi:N-acetyl-gamma-glutamyl-phosphate reductase / acetylglutamate kinase